ncbi:RNA chaperone Hfq [Sporosarcina soli]|uniref:RNA-binding protein Hfq n=1 Tax=Sporosarcina soli TaxID=334736 RepID=A0ABW0TFX9_9BACL
MAQRNMQDVFLNSLRKNNTFVTVFLTNGFQLKGLIKSYDNYTVLLESDGKQQLIYKHAISTYVPSKPVILKEED